MEIDDFISSFKSYLVSVNRISCYALSFKRNNISARELKFVDGELKKVLDKKKSIFFDVTCKNRQLKIYPYGDCKDTIEYRASDDLSIATRVQEITTKLANPDIAYDESENIDFDSYVLKLVNEADEKAYLFTRKKPIINLKNKNKMMFWRSGDGLETASTELYQLSLSIDTILFNQNIYFITLHMEKSFGLETYSKKQKDDFTEKLKDTLTEEEFMSISAILKRKNARSFKNINIDKIKKLSTIEGKTKISSALNIPLTQDNCLDMRDDGCKERLLDYLQDKLAKDVDNLSQCVGSEMPLRKYN